MGFDLGDADFAAPVAVLKNDLFDEISSQEGSWWRLDGVVGKKCRDCPQHGIETETKTAQKKTQLYLQC